MALTNFQNYIGPPINADFLNQLDRIREFLSASVQGQFTLAPPTVDGTGFSIIQNLGSAHVALNLLNGRGLQILQEDGYDWAGVRLKRTAGVAADWYLFTVVANGALGFYDAVSQAQVMELRQNGMLTSVDFRATGATTMEGTGPGVELQFTNGEGYVTAYDRDPDTPSYLPLNLRGSSILVNEQRLNATEVKIKSATTNRASTITVADDDELAGISLTAGFYSVEAWLNFANASVEGAGFQHSFAFTGTASGRKSIHGWVNGAVWNYPNTQSITSITQHDDITTLAAGDWVKVEGFLNVTVPGNLSLRWSQQSSDAAVTQLYSGSWIKVTKMG